MFILNKRYMKIYRKYPNSIKLLETFDIDTKVYRRMALERLDIILSTNINELIIKIGGKD